LGRFGSNLAQSPLAVVASEDQKFPEHWGFDVEAIEKAYGSTSTVIKWRGASHISATSQEFSFCGPDAATFAKGVEAYFTL